MTVDDTLRPMLHRYCARMTGSVVDGEDLVQDTLLEALTAAPAGDPARARAWMFRTAHNRAIDRWRSYGRRMREPLEAEPVDPAPRADDLLAREQAVHVALARFVALPPLQRSCVILKDVLGLSLDDIAALLETTTAAVQAALFRGRRTLHDQPAATDDEVPPRSPTLARYAALFSARDWEGVRAMLAEDVRLDVIERIARTGRGEVGTYFGNYARLTDWSLEVRVLDGREVLAVARGGKLSHVIAVTVQGDRIAAIRDYFHVPYILVDAQLR